MANKVTINIEAKDDATRIFINSSQQMGRSFDDLERRGSRSLGSLSNGFSRFKTVFLGAFTAIMASGAFRAFKDSFTEFVDLGDKIGKLSTRLSTSTEALSEYAFVAERSGVSFSALTTGLERMVRNVAEASKGTGEAKDYLAALGLEASKLAQMKPEEQFEVLAEAINRLRTESDKMLVAQKLFGRGGAELLQIVNQGTDAIREQRDTARDFGFSLSNEATKAAEEFKDALTDVSFATKGLAMDIQKEALPSLTKFINKLAEAASWLRKNRQEIIEASEMLGSRRGWGDVWGDLFGGGRVTKPMPKEEQWTGIEPNIFAGVKELGMIDLELPEKASRKRAKAFKEEKDALDHLTIATANYIEMQQMQTESTESGLDALSRLNIATANYIETQMMQTESTEAMGRSLDDLIANFEQFNKVPLALEEAKEESDPILDAFRQSFEATFFDLFKDGTMDIKEWWQETLQAMVQMWMRAMWRMAMEWLMFKAGLGGGGAGGGGGLLGLLTGLLKGIGGGGGGGFPFQGGGFGAAGFTMPMQGGGTLYEPVTGIGRSGRIYRFAEGGRPETVSPVMGGGGARNVTINIMANDAMSFRQMIQRDPDAIRSIIYGDAELGHPLFRR